MSTRRYPSTDSRVRADLAVKRLPLQRLDEVAVHLIGPQDDGRHRVLVLRRRSGEERQRRQGDVVLAAGQAALVVAVGAEAAGGPDRR